MRRPGTATTPKEEEGVRRKQEWQGPFLTAFDGIAFHERAQLLIGSCHLCFAPLFRCHLCFTGSSLPVGRPLSEGPRPVDTRTPTAHGRPRPSRRAPPA